MPVIGDIGDGAGAIEVDDVLVVGGTSTVLGEVDGVGLLVDKADLKVISWSRCDGCMDSM